MNIAIIQARLDSSRLPGKALLEIRPGLKVIDSVMKRVTKSKYLDRVVLATSFDESDNELATHAESKGYEVFRGSKDDVLGRYCQCAEKYQAQNIVRLTGDNPFIDPLLVDECLIRFLGFDGDFLANTMPPTYPDGQDIAVFNYETLEKANRYAESNYEKEHVTPWMRSSDDVKKYSVQFKVDYSHYRMTIDYKEDLDRIKKISNIIDVDSNFKWLDICKVIDKLDIKKISSQHSKQGHDHLASGPALWKKAKKLIPGGNMLLSKRAEMFLPGRWPTYFSSAKGCIVNDLDGNKYIDMSIMGIGTNILGYGNLFIDDAVRTTIARGNSSTLNCPEEVYLAERLIDLHPWSDMVRFARTGGEANSIAIRLARAATNKQKILVCGYHGWHDWYLALNLSTNNKLDSHLLPGLSPRGVSKSLENTVDCFNYNDTNKVKELFGKNNDIAAVIMEVKRNIEPKEGFLEEIRSLCTKNNSVLIFDECTSGFRESLGGLHLNYGVEPDMAMFGKALGNGYAITAVIGKESIMQEAQRSFISSTFWTERIGPTAGLATLVEMEKTKSWKQITSSGIKLQTSLSAISAKYDLDMKIFGIPSLTKFSFNSRNNPVCKTYITQEMLKNGFLAANSIYVSIAHEKSIIELYIENLENILADISKQTDEELMSKLEGPICHVDFQRLN